MIWQRDANFGFLMLFDVNTFPLFQTFGYILANSATWSAYLVKFLSISGFVFLRKQKIALHGVVLSRSVGTTILFIVFY